MELTMELSLRLIQIQCLSCYNCGTNIDASAIYTLYMEYLPLTHCCVHCYEQLMKKQAPRPSTVLIQHYNYDEGKTYISQRWLGLL